MSERRLQDLLRVTPDEKELEARASRARRLALGRLDELPAPASRPWRWKPVVALAGLCACAAFIVTRPPETTPAPEPLRVHMVLSDGTRVQWILHDDFKL